MCVCVRVYVCACVCVLDTEIKAYTAYVLTLGLQEHVPKAKFSVMDKFSTHFDAVEEQLKSSTVGNHHAPCDTLLPDPLAMCAVPVHFTRSGYS